MRIILQFLVLSILLFSCASQNSKIISSDSNRWITLFNGKDLSGWKPKIAGYSYGENFGNTFRVENGVLSTRYDQYGDFKERFGGLYYEKPFTNFRLKVEYRFVGELTPGAPVWGFRDGGINYMGQDPASIEIGQAFPVCLEYNLLGGNGKDERPTGDICAAGIVIQVNGKPNSLFCTPPSVKRTFPGEEWVTAEIEFLNGHVTHYVNSEKILEYSEPRWDLNNPIVKKLNLSGDPILRQGFISLQSNSHPMDFRKVEIMRLK